MFWDITGFMCSGCKQEVFTPNELNEDNLCPACVSKPEVVRYESN